MFYYYLLGIGQNQGLQASWKEQNRQQECSEVVIVKYVHRLLMDFVNIGYHLTEQAYTKRLI